jgi:hypothetical protein
VVLRAHVTVFLATGVLAATWAARLPDTAQRLGLSIGDLALVVLGTEGGALAGLPAGAVLVGRHGVAGCLRSGFVLYAATLPLLALAPTTALLVVVAAAWAAANSVVDVAANTAGVLLEARTGRPVLATLHGAQSIGVLGGGAVATAAATAGIALAVHFSVVGAAGALAVLLAVGAAPTGPRGAAPRPLARPDRRLVPIGAVAFCGFLVEGAATSWVGVHLSAEHGASPALAGAGYTALVTGLAAVRLLGDRIVTHLGRVGVVRASGAVTAAGAALVAIAPSVPVALAGWVVLGAGVALTAPTVIVAAPSSAADPARAIAAVTVAGYAGSSTGPPLIGAVAAGGSLSWALGACALAGLAAAALARTALRPP